MGPCGGGTLIWLHVSITEHQKNGSIWRGYPDLAPYGTYESSCNWNQISGRAQMVPIISGKTILNWNQIGVRAQMVPIISGKTVLDWNQIGPRVQMVPIPDAPHALCDSRGLIGTARNSIVICKAASLKIQGDVPYHWTHE